jgi:regulatory LuxR family protein
VKACGHGPAGTPAHAKRPCGSGPGAAKRTAPPDEPTGGRLGEPHQDLAAGVAAGGEGLTNGGVARRLYISPHTVNTHLRHVFAKLGVPNRAALAAVVHHSIK